MRKRNIQTQGNKNVSRSRAIAALGRLDEYKISIGSPRGK